MQRISNRHHTPNSSHMSPQVQYVDRITEVVGETETIIQERVIEVPKHTETIIEKHIHHEAPPVDLSPIHEHIQKLEHKLLEIEIKHFKKQKELQSLVDIQAEESAQLEMQHNQSRANRLLLIKKLRKEKEKLENFKLKIKLTIGVSLVLSILALILR